MKQNIFLILFLYSEALIEKFLKEADERNELDELLSDCAKKHKERVR